MKRVQAAVSILYLVVLAAWLIDTWTEGELGKRARSWWASSRDHLRRPPPFATGEAVVAEGIAIARQDAARFPSGNPARWQHGEEV